jgi:hypothetical protein
MSKPFRITVHVAGAGPITFDMTEAWIRGRAKAPRNVALRAFLEDGAQGDERSRLREVAYQMARRMLDPDQPEPNYPMGRTFTIEDDGGVWVIPVASVLALRMDDPEGAPQRPPLGFGIRDEPASKSQVSDDG